MIIKLSSYCFLIWKLSYLKPIFIAFAVIIFSQVFIQAQPLNFEHLTSENGLSHNKVQCIIQDKQGYIWFGTIYGLNRYDGYGFKVFKNIVGDSTTIANNNIISLYQDKDDLIWIGTSTALSSYNPRTESFSNYFLPGLEGWIHDFEEDENGLLWLATGYGLFSFDKKTNQAVYHSTGDTLRDNIHSILKDKNNDIFWLSTETGIRKFNKKKGSVNTYSIPYPAFSDISREVTHNLIKDLSGSLWMGTTEHGVYRLNPETEKWTNYHINIPDPNSVKDLVITQIMEDADGKIWICGEGLAIFDPENQSFFNYRTDITAAGGIPGKIRTIIKDRSGSYWLGTEKGIAAYDPKLHSFTTVKPNYPYTLQSANTIIEDKYHDFWVGNYTGIGTMDPNTGIYNNYGDILGLRDKPVFSSLLDKDGSIWFGSASCLLHVFKKNDTKVQGNWGVEKILIPVDRTVSITALASDKNGIIWVGTKGAGLLRYDPAFQSFKVYTGLANEENLVSFNIIKCLYAISIDSLLMGTDGNGLVLMQTKEEKFTRMKFVKSVDNSGFDHSIINGIYADNKKNIWIGTENDGLWQTDVALSALRNYSARDGLQSINITQVLGDDQGQIWLNTNLGLEIIDPSKKRFVHYSTEDGLSTDQTSYLIKKASGELIRVDFNGLHIFHSSSVNLNKDPPPVFINSLRVLDKTMPVYNDTTIYLKHYENYVSFGYVALNYTQPSKNMYAYKLQGMYNEWINADNNRSIAYANLAPGTYVFQVKACNNNGIWNEKGAHITLIISPPWWNTWWFYVLCSLLIFTTIYVLFQYKLQQKLKAFEIRNTISRDLHDEVGSTLSSIGFLSAMATNDIDSNKEKLKTSLNSISESSHKMLDAMNDIIWNIQPQNDILENIIARMLSFASELLEARNISLNYDIADNIKHLHLGLAIRHDFYVIFKEAVNNLAKYSGASHAFITLEFIHPFLTLSISDNGKGFDPQTIKKGNGVRNMQTRAKKIGAEYLLQSEPGNGTRITLQIRPT